MKNLGLIKGAVIFISASFLILGCGSKESKKDITAGSEKSTKELSTTQKQQIIDGVWEGKYISENSVGPVCIEIASTEKDIKGKLWIGGYVFGESYKGTVKNGNIQIELSSKNLYNEPVKLFINGSIENKNISGKIKINETEYKLEISKRVAPSCSYATREELVTLYGALTLGGIYQKDLKENNLNEKIIELLSVMKKLYKTNIRVTTDRAKLYTNWLANIWEINNKVEGYTETIGVVVHPSSFKGDKYKFLVWKIKGKEPNIGLNKDKNPAQIRKTLVAKSLNLTRNSALYIEKEDKHKFILPDGNNDKYVNKGTKFVDSEPFYISKCENNQRIKVWQVSIPFFLMMDGNLIINNKKSGTGVLETPTYISKTTSDLRSLYIEIEKCNKD